MYMWVCKFHAGLNLISLPFKGDAGDLKKKKKKKEVGKPKVKVSNNSFIFKSGRKVET